MPTRGFTTRFYRQWLSLPKAQREAFRRARQALFQHLTDQGFTPPFPASLRVHKLHGDDVWSVSFSDGYRAVFRLGAPVVPGHIHIVWEFIGKHAEYDRSY